MAEEAQKIDQKDFQLFLQAEEKASKVDEVPHVEKEQLEGETTAVEETPEPEKGVTEEETTPKVDVGALAKSTQALKRYGMTARMIDKLSADEIIEAGERLAKIQEDNDKAQSELKSLRITKEKPADGDKTPATVAADLSKWKARLADKFGDDVAPDLIEFVGELVKPLQSHVEAIQAREIQRTIDSAMNEVAGTYPSLKESATRDMVLEKARKIASAYEDEVSCLMDACKLLDIPTAASKAEAVSKTVGQATARKNGLPLTNGKSPQAASLSKEDLEMKAMLAFEDGNRDEGQRLMKLIKRLG